MICALLQCHQVFEGSPEFKGIETIFHCALYKLQGFEGSPEFKGIETPA